MSKVNDQGLDNTLTMPGYYDSPWPTECGGPRRQKAPKSPGFGITEKTIKSLKKADGLVVGSAICKEISKSIKNRQNAVTNVTNVVKRLKNKII